MTHSALPTPAPRIDFYVLLTASPEGRPQLACRLAEKAYQMGNRIYIHSESEKQAHWLNDLLWTYRSGSFIPHRLHPHPEATSEPVLVGYGEPPDDPGEVLINLAAGVPSFYLRFHRVAELVDQNDAVRAQGRKRYGYYRDQGLSPATHKLES